MPACDPGLQHRFGKGIAYDPAAGLAAVGPGTPGVGRNRPTVELMDKISKSKHVGILGTNGTITSGSYSMEIKKMFPHMTVTAKPARCGSRWSRIMICFSRERTYFDPETSGTYSGCRSGDRYACLGLHALSVADRKDQSVPACRNHSVFARGICGCKSDRLFAPPSRNGCAFDKARRLPLPDHRIRHQILRCRLRLPEPSGGGGTDFDRLKIKKN